MLKTRAVAAPRSQLLREYWPPVKISLHSCAVCWGSINCGLVEKLCCFVSLVWRPAEGAPVIQKDPVYIFLFTLSLALLIYYYKRLLLFIYVNCKWVFIRWQWYYNKTQHTNKHTSHKITHHAQTKTQHTKLHRQ
jgi:hypothetical protein